MRISRKSERTFCVSLFSFNYLVHRRFFEMANDSQMGSGCNRQGGEYGKGLPRLGHGVGGGYLGPRSLALKPKCFIILDVNLQAYKMA